MPDGTVMCAVAAVAIVAILMLAAACLRQASDADRRYEEMMQVGEEQGQ